jgi:uncharacterized damage-inducible protein DinB
MPQPPITGPSERLTPAQVRRLFAYNERVFDRFVRAVQRLPWRQAKRRRELGHQSLFGTLVHILNVHEVWVAYIVQGHDSDPELERLFNDTSRNPTDWKEFSAYNRRVWSSVHEYVDHVTVRQLGRPVKAFWMPGRYLASDGLLQSTFEQAHHLGEIIGALWQQDTEPPEMTWIRVGSSLTPGRR